jgi:hypothetical protein
MKKLLAAMFVALLMVGCGGDDDSGEDGSEIDLDDNETRNRIIAGAIDGKKLQPRGGNLYTQVSLQRSLFEKGEVLLYASNEQTPYTGWARIMYDYGLWGQPIIQINKLIQFKVGKPDGPFTHWYMNGQKQLEGTHKNGKLLTAVSWKPNGEKCPVTNVANGNGVRVWYRETPVGMEKGGRHTYKDGVKVEDSEIRSKKQPDPDDNRSY